MTETAKEWLASSGGDRETWFLSQLELDPLPVGLLLERLQALIESGDGAAAEPLMDMFAEVAADALPLEQLTEFLAIQAGVRADDRASREQCLETLRNRLEDDRSRLVFLDHIGFDKGLALSECLRRLKLLVELQQGTLCFDKTWGFGVVQRMDSFYKKVEIHFARKQGHEMSFAYAAETLELIDDDHLLARRHKDSDGLQALVRDQPGDVVRIALRSYGSLSATQLQDSLVPDIVPEPEWKKFWDAARRDLKKDSLVHLPSKRTEPIQLLEKEMAYDAEWFSALSKERNLSEILTKFDELLQERRGSSWTEDERTVISDRVGFVVRGATRKQTGFLVRALSLADSFGLTPEDVETDTAARELMEDRSFIETVRQLNVRDFKVLLNYLGQWNAEGLQDLLLRKLHAFPSQALSEVVDMLTQGPRAEDVAQIIRGQIDLKVATLDVFAWLAKHPECIQQWTLGTNANILNEMLTCLEHDVGERVSRGRTQLSGQIEQKAWLKEMMTPLTAAQRRSFLVRMKDTPAFEEMDRRSVLGKMIKAFPELEVEMSQGSGSVEGTQSTPRTTSERSYRERQNQLRQLVNVDIPSNSKEIAVARSYGDLRENHEFKAAKEMQTILLRREAELTQMLTEVSPTDFPDLLVERVNLGTGVRIRYADDREERFFLLGEWDRDEDLGIISSTTRMAQALLGHRVGDEVNVPGEDGEQTVAVEEVIPLPPEVRAWITVDSETQVPADAT